ncbi:MAG: GNAT family N-acetyltransferase, partial [Blastocatellia bacterium]|nr:GNAT family N-acetyltransferase [Blastocatellia bacterium]
GKTLVKSVIHWARECGVKKIELEVGEANKVAVLLYKSFGFFSEGLRQKTFLKNGKYWNTIRMSLFID